MRIDLYVVSNVVIKKGKKLEKIGKVRVRTNSILHNFFKFCYKNECYGDNYGNNLKKDIKKYLL
ncbi:MAG: hypothetical protein QXW97_00165 [Candidatus Pacearchaeota archaeon]